MADIAHYFQDTKAHRTIPLGQILDSIEYKGSRESRVASPQPYSHGHTHGTSVGAAVSTSEAALGNSNGGGPSAGDTLHAFVSPLPPYSLSGGEENDVHGGAGGLGGKKYTFKVITPKKTLLLCAPSEEEEVKWISAIRALIARRTKEAELAGRVTGGVDKGAESTGLSGNEKRKSLNPKEVEKRRSAQGVAGPFTSQ